jgi:hypothetical protein
VSSHVCHRPAAAARWIVLLSPAPRPAAVGLFLLYPPLPTRIRTLQFVVPYVLRSTPSLSAPICIYALLLGSVLAPAPLFQRPSVRPLTVHCVWGGCRPCGSPPIRCPLFFPLTNSTPTACPPFIWVARHAFGTHVPLQLLHFELIASTKRPPSIARPCSLHTYCHSLPCTWAHRLLAIL